MAVVDTRAILSKNAETVLQVGYLAVPLSVPGLACWRTVPFISGHLVNFRRVAVAHDFFR